MLELDYKKTGHWRIDAFELWYWRRLLRVPWTARRSNQSILTKSVLSIQWKDWCWSWSSNILATWCKERTSWKRLWCWERLKAEGEWDNRGWDGWMASPSQWVWVWGNSGSWWWTGSVGSCSQWGLRVIHEWGTELNWTELKLHEILLHERKGGILILVFATNYISQLSKTWYILDEGQIIFA